MIKFVVSFLILHSLFFLSYSEPLAKKKNKKKGSKSVSITKEQQVRSEKLFIEGMSHFLVGKYQKAIDRFKMANSIAPNNAGIHFKLGDAYFKEGVKSQAILHLSKAVDLDPNNKAYYFLLADVYKSEYRFVEAATTYEEMLDKVSGAEEFHLDLAKIYYYLGANSKENKPKENEQYLYKAIDSYNKAEGYYGIEEEIVNDKQQIYLKLNKLDKAIAEGEKLVKKNPDNILNRIRLADMKYRNGRKDEAISDLEKTVEYNPEETGLARLQLFEYYANDKQLEKSYDHLEKAFELSSLSLEVKVKLLEQYYYQKMHIEDYKKQALALGEKLIEKHPDKAMAHAVNGDVLYLSDNKEQARDAYVNALSLDNSKYIVWEQVVRLETDLQLADSVIKHADDALELFPNQPNLWLYKGLGHMILKDNQEAVLALEQGKKMTLGNKELEGFFNAQLGDGYNGLKEYEKADKAYDEALSVNPDNAHVLNNYSYYLSLRKSKLKKALTMSERLIELHPGEITYLDTYAWVLYQMEDYGKAEEYLKKAALDSENGTILEHYGDVLYQIGKEQEALEYWKKAKQQGETTDLIDKKISDKKLYEE